jgi:uncharacterized protein YllA (UPF0747 family)
MELLDVTLDFADVITEMQMEVARFKAKNLDKPEKIEAALTRIDKLIEIRAQYHRLYYHGLTYKRQVSKAQAEMMAQFDRANKLQAELIAQEEKHNRIINALNAK